MNVFKIVYDYNSLWRTVTKIFQSLWISENQEYFYKTFDIRRDTINERYLT